MLRPKRQQQLLKRRLKKLDITNKTGAVEAKIDEAVDAVAAKVEEAASDEWTCPSCGMKNDGKFCSVCGAKRP